MCGIAGYLSSKKLDSNIIRQTLDLMKRRGPNGQAFEQIQVNNDKVCYLLHSRLSIIDLDSRSNQPFHYNGKTIVYNGEIYNFIEVREKLTELGHRFITASDTEVLIHALDEWGIEALNIVEGMWAFAMYDHHTRTLTLSRDPFGEKPLYYYLNDKGEVYFGSEVKLLACLANKKFTVNIEKIQSFLINGYKSVFKNNDSFFMEIKPVKPASVLQIDEKGNINQFNYWDFKSGEKLGSYSLYEAIEAIKEKLIINVGQRLRADVPLAFCLSGGVDSNSLISIAKKIYNYDVHGFTILNHDQRYDEKEDIDKSVKQLKIAHTACYIQNENFFETLDEIVNCHDAPVLTLTYYMNWNLYKTMAEKGYKVAVMGTAADEIFSGYYDHHCLYLSDIKHNKKLYSSSVENWRKHIKPIVRNPYLSDSKIFDKDPMLRSYIYLNCEQFEKNLLGCKAPLFEEKFFNVKSLLKNRMLNELFYESVPVSLHEDDLNCMYYSIENRSPYLSRDLISFCYSLPGSFYIRKGMAKYLLRKAMQDIAPSHILKRRKKMGLNTPINQLIELSTPSHKKKILANSPIYEFVNHSKIASILEQSTFLNSESKFIFSFLSAKAFIEKNY